MMVARPPVNRRAIFKLLQQRRPTLPVVWGGVVSPHSSRPRARRVGAHYAVLESISAKRRRRSRIGRSHDSGQRLNSFMILSVTESDNHFPAENRDPRIDRQ